MTSHNEGSHDDIELNINNINDNYNFETAENKIYQEIINHGLYELIIKNLK